MAGHQYRYRRSWSSALTWHYRSVANTAPTRRPPLAPSSPYPITDRRAAEVTGGALSPEAKAVFDPAGETIRYHQDLWPRFIMAAMAVYLLDLLVRRVRFFDRKVTARPVLAKSTRS